MPNDNSDSEYCYEGRKVLVVGLGRSGIAAAKLLYSLGARVTITERKEIELLEESIKALPEDVRVVAGGHQPALLDGTDLVVVSPGVPLDQPIFAVAGMKGIEVIGELELAYRVAKPYGIQWVAVTGSNGKSTTTTLIDLMLKAGGCNVLTGGNIGNAITDEIRRQMETGIIADLDYIVVEVSSFQLESIKDFRPTVASILNISPDHLDRYSSMDEYIMAKTNIYMNQKADDYLILNREDSLLRGISDGVDSEILYFSKCEIQDAVSAFIKEGYLCINTEEGALRIIPVDEIRIKGVHNLENSLAASLNAYLCGVDPASIRRVLREVPGLEHRMEFVGEIGGVKFYNDSKGTNIGSVIKSLEGFSADVVLILWGRDKGGDFSPLGEYITERVKGMVVIGEARDKIIRQIGDIATTVTAMDMSDAVEKAYEIAEPGGTVLLSPGCASFDMFMNFEHRGRVFKESVRRLGESLNTQ
jgi:UDP-N-acetylmuramoylalanine--D-glutamate ligase